MFPATHKKIDNNNKKTEKKTKLQHFTANKNSIKRQFRLW